jgi:hypothetical protein
MNSNARVRLGFLVAAAAVAAAAGCNDNDLGIERRRPNRPPETILSSSPQDSTYNTSYRVQLFWTGSDADGTIDHYDFIMVDHAAIGSCIECPPDDPRAVVVDPPAVDDPRWTATAGTDTVIITRADTLRTNPIPPDGVDTDAEVAQHNIFVRMQNFERWHTFFVRAVDNEGQVDLTPEYVSFNSTNLAPEVGLLPPINPLREEFFGPRVIVFNWDGRDPIGDNTFIDPIASRWVMIRSLKNTTGYLSYPDSLYYVPEFGKGGPGRPTWSMWARWDRADGLGRRAVVRGLDPVGSAPGLGWYLFAVQAMDEAGAVTPVFDATNGGKNNVARVFVLNQFGATLVVDDRFLGQYTFGRAAQPISLAVAAGQAVQFRWRGDASPYGGSIVAYRYGWNILNPDNDQDWEQNWCETCVTAPPRVFASGLQRFFVETRDNAGTVTRAEIELAVNQITRRRDLLLVDDTDNFADDPLRQELREDDRWANIITALRQRQPFAFDPARDIYDVGARRQEPPPISLVFDYKTIVWNAKVAGTGVALRTLTQFIDPFVDRNRDRQVRFNYLSVYIENEGEIWLSGQQPTSYLWLFAPMQLRPYPFNVTNWDDPIMPHPQEDSVGVRSFLWRMGAEVVDVGSGGQGQQLREGLQHFCIGFRRATPQGNERQVFASSRAEDHQHDLEIPTSDVEAPPTGGRVYTTSLAAGAPHTHTVTLSAEDLGRLAHRDVLDVVTSPADMPAPHTHTFTLRDQVGLWGAPQSLETERSDWAQPSDPALNPAGGRPSVEIYNMPSFIAAQSPRLNPDPDIWEPLFSYVSSVPVDPVNGVLYPQTADGQPAIIARRSISGPANPYTRVFCGFEVWRLRQASHLALADFVLLNHFRLGRPD